MASTTVTLTSVQAALLEGLVAKGHFSSTEAALACSLDMLVEATYSPQYTPQEVAHLLRGLEKAEQGNFVPQEEVEALFESWRTEDGG